MARPDHVFVFAYDISRDADRVRVAGILEVGLVRVQQSVFEGRMRLASARRLAESCARYLGPADSLRVYCVTEGGRRNSLVHGAGVLPEADDFYLV